VDDVLATLAIMRSRHRRRQVELPSVPLPDARAGNKLFIHIVLDELLAQTDIRRWREGQQRLPVLISDIEILDERLDLTARETRAAGERFKLFVCISMTVFAQHNLYRLCQYFRIGLKICCERIAV